MPSRCAMMISTMWTFVQWTCGHFRPLQGMALEHSLSGCVDVASQWRSKPKKRAQFDCAFQFYIYSDLPVPYIFGTKLPVANVSGNWELGSKCIGNWKIRVYIIVLGSGAFLELWVFFLMTWLLGSQKNMRIPNLNPWLVVNVGRLLLADPFHSGFLGILYHQESPTNQWTIGSKSLTWGPQYDDVFPATLVRGLGSGKVALDANH